MFGALVLYYNLIHLDETYNFSDETVNITIRDCSVYLKNDVNVSAGSVEISVIAYNNSTVTEEEGSISIENPTRDLNICEVMLKSSYFPSLGITCMHRCQIESDENLI